MTCPVLIASPDLDFGLCRAADAPPVAQGLADAEGVPVTIRCPLSDAVLRTFTPATRER